MLFDGGSLTVGGVTFKNAGGASYGALALPRALQVSSDVFFYRLGLMADQHGGDMIQKWARRLGLGHADRHRPARRGARASCPTPAWRNRLFRKKLTDRPWTPGDNINLSVGQGDLQADPLQMAVAYSAIANGGRVVTPHIGMRVEDPDGRVLQEIEPGARRTLDISSADARRRSCRACARRRTTRAGPRRRCSRASRSRSRARPARPSAAPRATSPGTWRAAPYNDPRIVVAVDDRARRVRRRGGGAGGAPDPGRLLRDQGQEGGRRGRERPGLMTPASSPTPFGTGVQRFSEPRQRLLRLDLLVLLATLGLLAFSLVTLDAATATDVPGSPDYFVTRQALYAVVGLVLMLVLASIDYSRFRELRVGLYVAMIGLIVLVLAVGGATRGSRRWIELPFFRFQPSELGKVLLVLALSAFVIDRVRRLSDREMTSRIMLLALVPTLLVMAQPDLGTSIVYVTIALALLFVAGTKWTHFAALGGSRRPPRRSGPGGRARGRHAGAEGLPAGPPDGVPRQGQRRPQSQGYQLKQAETAIGSGRKTGRGTERATQTRLDFLPESHTDFIFAVVGERYGFVGARSCCRCMRC